MIDIKYKNSNIPSYYTFPSLEGKKFPGIMLIHEIWGLNDHIKNVADRLKDKGYAVIAPNLLSDTGILEKINPHILR